MSIDKESNGLPQVDVKRRTTKVNFGIVIGVALFFAAMNSALLDTQLGAAAGAGRDGDRDRSFERRHIDLRPE